MDIPALAVQVPQLLGHGGERTPHGTEVHNAHADNRANGEPAKEGAGRLERGERLS